MNSIVHRSASAALTLMVAGAGLSAQPQMAGAVNTGTVVAIGDSYPSGDGGGGNWHRGYPEMSAGMLGTSTLRLTTKNYAQSGWTSGDVLDGFNRTDAMKQIATANTVIITVGANDVLNANPDPRQAAVTTRNYHDEVLQAKANLDTILRKVSVARRGNMKRVVVADYNTVYRQGGSATWAGSTFIKGANNVTIDLNANLLQVCRKYRATCVDVYPAFQTANVQTLVVPDGTHPSTAGHRVYANKIVAAVRARA